MIPRKIPGQHSSARLRTVDGYMCRLSSQYSLTKKVSDRTSAVPHSVDLAGVSEVLDVAAGTLVWTLGFASMMEVGPAYNPAFRIQSSCVL